MIESSLINRHFSLFSFWRNAEHAIDFSALTLDWAISFGCDKSDFRFFYERRYILQPLTAERCVQQAYLNEIGKSVSNSFHIIDDDERIVVKV